MLVQGLPGGLIPRSRIVMSALDVLLRLRLESRGLARSQPHGQYCLCPRIPSADGTEQESLRRPQRRSRSLSLLADSRCRLLAVTRVL